MFQAFRLLFRDYCVGVVDIVGFVEDMIIGIGDDAEVHDKGNDNQKAEPEMFPPADSNNLVLQRDFSRLPSIQQRITIIPLYESALKDYNRLVHFIEE